MTRHAVITFAILMGGAAPAWSSDQAGFLPWQDAGAVAVAVNLIPAVGKRVLVGPVVGLLAPVLQQERPTPAVLVLVGGLTQASTLRWLGAVGVAASSSSDSLQRRHHLLPYLHVHLSLTLQCRRRMASQ